MRIIVNKQEFANLVVECRKCKEHGDDSYPCGCYGCIFYEFCDGKGIENICDIKEQKDEENITYYRSKDMQRIVDGKGLPPLEDYISPITRR